MKNLIELFAATALSTVLLCGPTLAAGIDAGYWPSERQERLAALDKKVLEVQRNLFNARMSGDQATIARLAPAFKELNSERVNLLRTMNGAR